MAGGSAPASIPACVIVAPLFTRRGDFVKFSTHKLQAGYLVSHAIRWLTKNSPLQHIHCGCIASVQNFTLLDAGGVECITCAKRSGRHVLPGNLAYPPPSHGVYKTPFSERIRDLSTKSWSQFSGVGPMQWREAPNLYNSLLAQSEAHTRGPCDGGVSNGLNRYYSNEVFPLGSLEKQSRREIDWSMRRIARTSEIHENGNSGVLMEMLSAKENSSALRLEPLLKTSSANESNCEMTASGSLLRAAPLSQPPKSFHSNHSSEFDPCSETPVQNGRSRGDGRNKNQLLTRYLPRTTDEELQKIAGSSEIKPLFEKTLSASDAGRIGRLVVPKKCAEAYFPHISQPEGLPLKVQDVKGKEWVFQFRFWPNNNSRMYVLEGVTSYIQSMQLLAGDKVTFSRLEPEGKLVMGFRKASNGSTDLDDEPNKISNNGDASARINFNLSRADKSGYIAKDIMNVKSSVSRKRKSSTFSSNRHLLFESMDVCELKITLEEAQRLIRPSPNHLSHVGIVENEIEEFEDCPVIGKPTIFTTDQMGESIQWAQCEDCLKWRRLPADALLPAKWICSKNKWDLARSTCSSPQDISDEQLDNLLFPKNQSVSKKMRAANQELETVEGLEGLDALANLAILGEGQAIASSGHITTKHPRHKMGCSCIVCIQPPSGKGLKHKQTCDCTVCLTVKRRFQTLMLRREKKQQEKDAEAASEKHQGCSLLIEKSPENDPLTQEDSSAATPTLKEVTDEGSVDISFGKESSASTLKGQIDLNIKPERDDPLISSELDTLMFSYNTAEAVDQMQSSIHCASAEIVRDPTQTVEVVDGTGSASVTNQLVAAPPADAHPEKESSPTVKVEETIVNSTGTTSVTNQLVAAPPADAHPEKESSPAVKVVEAIIDGTDTARITNQLAAARPDEESTPTVTTTSG
uniref:Uncharacterized protein n=1 Tax=Kalanchoe fedtschenkoi TaxID=63787 RepID=A0A7N0TQ64_KALFE